MKNLIVVLILCFSSLLQAQNNTEISPQGISFPQKALVSTTDVVTVSPSLSQMVYNTNVAITGAGADGTGYYFWNGTNWKKLAVGPVSGGGGSLPTTGIVLSETEGNSPLSNAGFSLIGKINGLSFQPFTQNLRIDWTKNATPVSSPSGRLGHCACWLNNKMLIWGGGVTYYSGGQTYDLNTGGLYSPQSDNWTSTSTIGVSARRYASMVCYGTKAIIYGGISSTSPVNIGNIYDASNDTWSSISNLNAPSARFSPSVIWTGSQMIIFGGSSVGSSLNTGGVYNPTTDTWTPTSITNPPSIRAGHSAIWTGTKMIVWGGSSSGNYLNDGKIYDPSNDTWSSISSTGAPSARSGHAAIWTGSKMVVLSGYADSGSLSDGGIYDPSNDTWTSLSAGTSLLGNVYSVLLNDPGFAQPYILIAGDGYNSAKVLNTSTWLSENTNSYSPNRMQSLVTNGHSAITWGGYSINYNNGNYDYNQVGNFFSPTNFLPAQSTPFYLFKKN